MGEVDEMVGSTVAAGLQSQKVARVLEEDAFQQPKSEGPARLDAEGVDGRGIGALFRKLPGAKPTCLRSPSRSEEHTSELQSLRHLVCRLLLEKKKRSMDSARNAATQITAVRPHSSKGLAYC